MRRSPAFTLVAAVAWACSVAPDPVWIPQSKTADALYAFSENGKVGYIDQQGQVVIEPRFATPYPSAFHDGLLESSGWGGGGYVDRSGKPVLRKGYYRAWEFSEGLAAAMPKDKDLWGYIDTTGEFVISPRFKTYPNGYVFSFSDGLARIEIGGRYGFIDRSGDFVIPPNLLDAEDFRDGMARVVLEGPCVYFPEGACGSFNPRFPGGRESDYNTPPCRFTFLDKSGRPITPARFDGARAFAEGLAPVRLGDSWGFLDKEGMLVISPAFQDARPFSSGLARIRDHGLYGYIDHSGRTVIASVFEHAGDFQDGLAVAGGGGERYWYINRQGERAFAEEFALASPFFKGLAHVKLPLAEPQSPPYDPHATLYDQLFNRPSPQQSTTFAYIDTEGRRVFTYPRRTPR